jgi:uncharacterized membrane protein YbjE (DUF340 family)
MKDSLYSIIAVVAGISITRLFTELPQLDYSYTILLLILILVGISLGVKTELSPNELKLNWRILILPIGTIVGTFLPVLIISPLIPVLDLKESLLIVSGMGYYSLASIMVTGAVGGNIVLMVFFSSLIREFLVLLFANPLHHFFGDKSLISIAASASDTCLPVIVKHTGHESTFEILFNGTVIGLFVPLIISLILKF